MGNWKLGVPRVGVLTVFWHPIIKAGIRPDGEKLPVFNLTD
jgi:hypothetical protein